MTKPDWRQFEESVASFCQALAPDARVTHDAMIPDLDTGRPRQRDVWIEASVGGHFPVKLLISCKRYKRKLNAQDVDAFIGELLSSGAHKGVIYSSSGFAKAALEKAAKRGISCCALLIEQPPPIPEVLVFEAYCYREGLRLRANGLGDTPDWPTLLALEVDFEDQPVPAYKVIAKKFEAERTRVNEGIGTMPPLHRQAMLTGTDANAKHSIQFGIENTWAIYRARNEAWLVNGSYSFTDGDFKGSLATPAIDTWTGEPCEGWELIEADRVGAGSATNFYMLLGNVEPRLAAIAHKSLPA